MNTRIITTLTLAVIIALTLAASWTDIPHP